MKRYLIIFTLFIYSILLSGCGKTEIQVTHNVELTSTNIEKTHHTANRDDSSDYDYDTYYFYFDIDGKNIGFQVDDEIYFAYNKNKRFNISYYMENSVPKLKSIEPIANINTPNNNGNGNSNKIYKNSGTDDKIVENINQTIS